MLRFIAQRLLVTALVIAVTSIVAFSLVHLTGDPAVAMAGENASPEDVEAIRKLYGFDRPIWEQYLTWVARFVAGDFGRSHYLKLGVGEVLAEHIPVTAMLGVLALGFALALSIPLGVVAALRPNTMIDRLALWIAVAGQALPSFLFALGLIYVFGVLLRWLPVSGDATWQHFILPSVALGYYATPAIMRLTRSSPTTCAPRAHSASRAGAWSSVTDFATRLFQWCRSRPCSSASCSAARSSSRRSSRSKVSAISRGNRSSGPTSRSSRRFSSSLPRPTPC